MKNTGLTNDLVIEMVFQSRGKLLIHQARCFPITHLCCVTLLLPYLYFFPNQLQVSLSLLIAQHGTLYVRVCHLLLSHHKTGQLCVLHLGGWHLGESHCDVSSVRKLRSQEPHGAFYLGLLNADHDSLGFCTYGAVLIRAKLSKRL